MLLRCQVEQVPVPAPVSQSTGGHCFQHSNVNSGGNRLITAAALPEVTRVRSQAVLAGFMQEQKDRGATLQSAIHKKGGLRACNTTSAYASVLTTHSYVAEVATCACVIMN
jgi:hypothetical protein